VSVAALVGFEAMDRRSRSVRSAGGSYIERSCGISSSQFARGISVAELLCFHRLSMSSSSANKNYLNRLPPELRRMIWSSLLTLAHLIKISYKRTPSVIPDDRGQPRFELVRGPIRHSSILRVSKTINQESEEVLYRSNIFEFHEFKDDLGLFLQSISLRAYLAIKSIVLYWPKHQGISNIFLPALDLLGGCIHLQTLVIHDFEISRVFKGVKESLGGLRLKSIDFPNTSIERVRDLFVPIEGNGGQRSTIQERTATESRAIKVRSL
jgi:hypothetical protein